MSSTRQTAQGTTQGAASPVTPPQQIARGAPAVPGAPRRALASTQGTARGAPLPALLSTPRPQTGPHAATAPQGLARAPQRVRGGGADAGRGAEESSGSSDEAEDAGAAYVGQSGGPDGQHAPQWGPGPSNPPDNWLSR